MSHGVAVSSSVSSGAYEYRWDGLRVKKTVVNTSSTTVDHFRYDGQMPFEDEKISGTSVSATREALGARGVDAEEAVTGTYNTSTGVRTLNTPTISFPLYDARQPDVLAFEKRLRLLHHRHRALLR